MLGERKSGRALSFSLAYHLYSGQQDLKNINKLGLSNFSSGLQFLVGALERRKVHLPKNLVMAAHPSIVQGSTEAVTAVLPSDQLHP